MNAEHHHYSTNSEAPARDDVADFIRFALVTGLTKKATKRRRKSITRDRRNLAKLGTFATSAASAIPSPLVLKSLTPLRPLTTPSPFALKAIANDNADTRDPPSWDHTTHVAKLWAANRALLHHGALYAFSLDPSPSEIAKAHASPKGFAGHFREAITRALKRKLGRKPMFWIAVDLTPGGRLHLHGGLALEDGEGGLIASALQEAGDEWASAYHKDKQVDLAHQYEPDGWARYAIRMRSKVRHIVGDRQTYAIANGLIDEARRHYEGLRRQVANRDSYQVKT
jgi:hypothetical protein